MGAASELAFKCNREKKWYTDIVSPACLNPKTNSHRRNQAMILFTYRNKEEHLTNLNIRCGIKNPPISLYTVPWNYTSFESECLQFLLPQTHCPIQLTFFWIIADLRKKYTILLAALQRPLKTGDSEREGRRLQMFPKLWRERRISFI